MSDVTRAEVCVLERGSGKRASLERVGPHQLRPVLLLDHLEDRDRYGAKLDEVAERLVKGGGWRLTLTDDPADAVPLVKQALSQVAAR